MVEFEPSQQGRHTGIDSSTARNSVWQFLNKTTDPRLSMLLKFCAALEMPIEDLLGEKKKSRSK